MQIARRSLRRAGLTLALIVSLLAPALAAERARVKAEDYVIDAEIVPKTHRLLARAKVKITALDDTSFATFELSNALRPTRIVDGNGKPLTSERISADSSLRVSFPAPLTKGTSTTLTFEYEGALSSADDSPVEGLKLAYIGEDTSYLLYSGRWFPVTNYGIDRFTSTINITAPTGTVVVGSGSTSAAKPAAAGKSVTAPLSPGPSRTTFSAAAPYTSTFCPTRNNTRQPMRSLPASKWSFFPAFMDLRLPRS
jgi:hypothetical protein